MKPSLAIRTLFRTMGKTVFTFLLIAILTFSLFIQLAEYFKTQKEFLAAVDSYSGIGYVEYEPALYKGVNINYPYYIEADPRVNAIDIPALDDNRYLALSTETVDQIAQLPYVSSAHRRYMTAGVSDQYKRLKEDATRYDYNGRIIVEGTLGQRIQSLSNRPWYNGYTLQDAKILAGDAERKDLLFADGTIRFEANSFNQDDTIWPKNYMGLNYVPRAIAEDQNYDSIDGYWRIKHVTLKNYAYGRTFQEQLKEGDRYVFVCRFERQATNRMLYMAPINVTQQSLELYDWVSEHNWPAACNITDAPENYLDLPEYAPLKELIDVTQTDLRTFDVVYAGDMTAIREIHDNTMQLSEGRWLTTADTEQNAKVCVIDEELASRLKLKLGDRLPLELGNELFEQFYSLGAIASVPERFSKTWTPDEFEIVGIYKGSTLAKAADEPNWAYSMNTVFVPLASLPETVDLTGHEFAPGEVTFRVNNAWDIAPFLEESAPKIEAMGLTLNFDDGGWMEVLEGYQVAQRVPLIRIVLVTFVTATGLALSVYLFVSRKKKDYAIMRALGTPKGRSGRALLIPMLVLSLAAVLLGIVAGAVYSLLTLGGISPLPILICLAGELVFTLLFAGLSIRKLSKLPPLALLQASQNTAKKQKVKKQHIPQAAATGTLYHPTEALYIPREPLPITKRPASLGFKLRYIWRHIRRQGVKSILSVLLAVLLVGAVTQLASLRDTYNGLRETTVVPVRFVNSMSLNNLQKLEDEGFTKDVYYERIAHISCLVGAKYSSIQIVITSDIGRFLNQAYEIHLGAGYTGKEIEQMDYVLAGPELMEEFGFQDGDMVRFALSSDIKPALEIYENAYLLDNYYNKGLVPDAYPTSEEIYEHSKKKIDRAFDLISAKAELIGTITTESGKYDNTVFTAGLDNMQSLVGSYQTMPLIEFTLADNSRLEEMRELGLEMTNGREGAFVMDSEALESVIRTSDLLNGLFPAVVALALLIGAAMCALLVMQTGKDAAIMRAQGTTKRTTRSMLAVEQILLGVGGILLGLLVMLAWKRAAFSAIAVQAGLFAAAYVLVLVLGSYVSAGIATRKNILELLQTKE